MGMKFKDKIMLQGCREGYCEYGPASGILCWVYDVLGESYFTCLSGLMGSKADSRFGNPWSFLGRVDFSIFDIVNRLWKSNGGRGRRPNFVFLGGDGMEQSLV